MIAAPAFEAYKFPKHVTGLAYDKVEPRSAIP